MSPDSAYTSAGLVTETTQIYVFVACRAKQRFIARQLMCDHVIVMDWQGRRLCRPCCSCVYITLAMVCALIVSNTIITARPRVWLLPGGQVLSRIIVGSIVGFKGGIGGVYLGNARP